MYIYNELYAIKNMIKRMQSKNKQNMIYLINNQYHLFHMLITVQSVVL